MPKKCNLFHYLWSLFQHRCADAAVGRLDVQHGAHGGGNVGHVGEA